MQLISYREAAKLAGCSLASVQRAVKSGHLHIGKGEGVGGLIREEVLIWKERRFSTQGAKYAIARVHQEWTQATVHAILQLWRSREPTTLSRLFGGKNPSREHDIDIVTGEIYNFVKRCFQKRDRFNYSEGVFFENEENADEEIEFAKRYYNNEEISALEQGLKYDLDFRWQFSIFSFAAGKLENLNKYIREMGLPGLVGLQAEDLGLDSIFTFRKKFTDRLDQPQ